MVASRWDSKEFFPGGARNWRFSSEMCVECERNMRKVYFAVTLSEEEGLKNVDYFGT
jgi:hypothetical protein